MLIKVIPAFDIFQFLNYITSDVKQTDIPTLEFNLMLEIMKYCSKLSCLTLLQNFFPSLDLSFLVFFHSCVKTNLRITLSLKYAIPICSKFETETTNYKM